MRGKASISPKLAEKLQRIDRLNGPLIHRKTTHLFNLSLQQIGDQHHFVQFRVIIHVSNSSVAVPFLLIYAAFSVLISHHLS